MSGLRDFFLDWVMLQRDIITPAGSILDLILKFHKVVFIALFLAAAGGKRLGIRKAYIHVLDRMFAFAASKLENNRESEDALKENDFYVEDEIEGKAKEMELEGGDDEDEERVIISPKSPRVPRHISSPGTFRLDDLNPYMVAGMRAIVDDDVSSSLLPEELRSWNMLSRTKTGRVTKQAKSVTALWVSGFIFRYFFLVPVRLLIFAISLSNLIICTFLVGLLPDGPTKRSINAFVLCWCFDSVANTLSVCTRFHDKQFRPSHGVAVANHTTPIDAMLLASDNCYDMVGQKTKGILGWFMSALSRSSTHIWFERSNYKDRAVVSKLLQEHASKVELPPILIFPEGVCVNNTAVMQFRKGVFELDTVIHPIAIRFDARYGDAFWSQDGFIVYILSLISSWAIVCDLWYLPPMRKGLNESPVEFANRVKSEIARKGGLKELEWDGLIKTLNEPLKKAKEAEWKKKQQHEFAKTLNEKI